MQIEGPASIAAAIAKRHGDLAATLKSLTAEELMAPSLLPDWSRLTIVCHLRYGAEASHAMTLDALAARPTAFYPHGRATQRPLTLIARGDEDPQDVVVALAEVSARLDALWRTITTDQWHVEVHEPDDKPDLGTVTLGQLALLRLTEVEVHGSDLDIGLRPWSGVFVNAALPMRVRWLTTRRSNHAHSDTEIYGTWILRPSDGSAYAVSAGPTGVAVSEGTDRRGDTEICGPGRDILAFMLGRLDLAGLTVSGDAGLAASFLDAFPAP